MHTLSNIANRVKKNPDTNRDLSFHESGIRYTSSSRESGRMERLHAGSLLYIASSGESHCKYKSSSGSLGDLWRNNKSGG